MNTLLSLIQASLFLDDYFKQLQKYKIIMKKISIKQYIDLAKPKSGSQGPGYSKIDAYVDPGSRYLILH